MECDAGILSNIAKSLIAVVTVPVRNQYRRSSITLTKPGAPPRGEQSTPSEPTVANVTYGDAAMSSR